MYKGVMKHDSRKRKKSSSAQMYVWIRPHRRRTQFLYLEEYQEKSTSKTGGTIDPSIQIADDRSSHINNPDVKCFF
jgi:hypothetical protein